MRHIVRRVARTQRIEIVAADAALHFWEFFGDLVRLARAEIEHVAEQIEAAIARILSREIARHLAEMQEAAVGKRCIHRYCIVPHAALPPRTSPPRIIARQSTPRA